MENPHQAAYDAHYAKWEPITASWRIAKLCREIGALLPAIANTPAALEAYLPGLSKEPTIVADLADMLKRKADALEAACPLPTPITDHIREEYAEAQAECFSDMSTRDRCAMVLEDTTDAAIAEDQELWALEEMLDAADRQDRVNR